MSPIVKPASVKAWATAPLDTSVVTAPTLAPPETVGPIVTVNVSVDAKAFVASGSAAYVSIAVLIPQTYQYHLS